MHNVQNNYNAVWSLDKEPDLCRVADRDGNLPIHCFAAQDFSSTTLEFAICRYPKALQQASGEGQLALHRLARRYVSRGWFEVVDIFLDWYPEGAGRTDNCGNTPLHLFVQISRPSCVSRWDFGSLEWDLATRAEYMCELMPLGFRPPTTVGTRFCI